MLSLAPFNAAARFSRSTTTLVALFATVLVCLLAATQANAAAPVITGAPHIDTSETLSAGGWAEFDGIDYEFPGDTDFFFQWYLCSGSGGSCISLLGETESDIDIREGWVGKTIRLRVTIANEENEAEFDSVLSSAIGPIVEGTTSAPGAIINHGHVQMGVNPEGELIVDGGTPSAEGDQSTLVGLRLAPLNLESISDGSPAEGWGVADQEAFVAGWANRDTGGATNLKPVSFTSDEDSATSTVDLVDNADSPVIRVSHAFAPSTSASLFEATVTLTNKTDSTIDHTRYRRLVDWDIQPTPYDEFVTIRKGDSPALIDTTNNGFSSTNPLESLNTCNATDHSEDLNDDGPNDCGAAFDFDFGALEPGDSKEFKLYYGAAPDEATALSALQEVGAEAYTLGQSDTDFGALAGTPATFMLAFSDIGGDPLLVDDDLAGNTIIDSGPATYSSDDTPEFSFFSTDDDAEFQCSMDGSDWFSCDSPLADGDPLDEGWHNFRVRAVVFDEVDTEDLIGVDETPAALNFKVDKSAPHTYVGVVGTSPEVTDSPKFKFESDDGEPSYELTYECVFDSGSEFNCTDGLELSDLSEGDHELQVTATDLAGNVESPSVLYSWTYTYVAPPVTQFTTPGGAVSGKNFEIGFAAAGDIDYYRCSLDGASFSECQSPVQITDLDEGAHSFKVYAIAYNGLIESTPKELTFSYASPKPPVTLPLPARPSGKLGKPSKKGVVKLTAICNEAVCTITANVKIGKKKYKLKGKALPKGTSTVKLTFNKKLKNALKKKHRKKAVMTVVLTSSVGSTTVTKRF